MRERERGRERERERERETDQVIKSEKLRRREEVVIERIKNEEKRN